MIPLSVLDLSPVTTGGSGPIAYASMVTLRSRLQEAESGAAGAGAKAGAKAEHVIEGYVSGNSAYIGKLGRFTASFAPQGTLLILHNYDEPGKIGGVGTVLGRHGVNVRFMQVAGLDCAETEAENGHRNGQRNGNGVVQNGEHTAANEALMILGVAGDVTREVVEDLGKSEGILNVNVVRL